MGNFLSSSKKSKEKDKKLSDRERRKKQKREEKKKKKIVTPGAVASTPPPFANLRTYDEQALDLMREQLNNDSDAFLLNNILLSVQFFSNFESEWDHIKNNPIGNREQINNAMVQHHKHVFFADQMQDSVHEHLSFQKTETQAEPLVVPRLFVVYDNIEASESGESPEYSTVLDAPVYKLCIQDGNEPGYVRLQKLEVLKNTAKQQLNTHKNDSDNSVYTDSERESFTSDGVLESNRDNLLENNKNPLCDMHTKDKILKDKDSNVTVDTVDGRRASGPIKQFSLQAQKGSISNINYYKKVCHTIHEDIEKDDQTVISDTKGVFYEYEKPRKSILKNSNNTKSPVIETKTKVTTMDTISEDTETSGYRSNSYGRQNDFSGSESDYGYSTITQSATPKKIELSLHSNESPTSGVLPDEIWSAEDVRLDYWSEDDKYEDDNECDPKMIDSRNLYETKYYLNSTGFMRHFVDIFITDLGSCLEFPEDAIHDALTQGASVYCNTIKNEQALSCEIYPAVSAPWLIAARPFITRERKLTTNPRTNHCYQWPTKEMVNEARESGCFLIPIGYRVKRGENPDRKLQWKVVFPAAERYLEKFLAHSHVRCYLFALILHKAFMENDTSKVGIEARHIKHQLFWQCEENFGTWPEDRLGQPLIKFLKKFYNRFAQSRLPNYFMSNCNEFKNIPTPVLRDLQKKLADILETPVTHTLYALSKLNYHKKDFYPTFDAHRLYEILTCNNPLRLVNPSIPLSVSAMHNSDVKKNTFNNKTKVNDTEYLRKKRKQKELENQAKREAYNKKQKVSATAKTEMKPNIKLPSKMEPQRRRLVLEFFIPHFIAMSRSSEKFEAIGQAIIYLEQAQRLCILLQSEPMGESTANDYLEVIKDKLDDCQRKLANQVGYKLPLRRESVLERTSPRKREEKKHRHRFDKNHNITDSQGIPALTFVDVHLEEQNKNGIVKFTEMECEESKL